MNDSNANLASNLEGNLYFYQDGIMLQLRGSEASI